MGYPTSVHLMPVTGNKIHILRWKNKGFIASRISNYRKTWTLFDRSHNWFVVFCQISGVQLNTICTYHLSLQNFRTINIISETLPLQTLLHRFDAKKTRHHSSLRVFNSKTNPTYNPRFSTEDRVHQHQSIVNTLKKKSNWRCLGVNYNEVVQTGSTIIM